MINKNKFIFEIIILIVALSWTTYKMITPELKENSSDKIIKTSNYESLIEFKINETNFGLVIDKNKNIYHILYFDKTSICLNDKNIESNDLEGSINQLIRNLIENDILKNNSTVVLTKYKDKYYKDIKNIFLEYLSKYKININLIEEEISIYEKTKILTTEETDNEKQAIWC